MSAVEAVILGREYRVTLARVKRWKRGPVLLVPREDLEWVLGGDREALAIVMLARATHLHGLYWEEPDTLWEQLPPETKTELSYLGSGPVKPRGRLVLVAASEEEVRRLGLDPSNAITLTDVERAVERRLREALLEGRGPRG